MAARHNRTAVDNQAWQIGSGKRHREAWSILVAMVQSNDRVITMRRTDHLCSVGDLIATCERCPSIGTTLHEIVADSRHAKRKSDQACIGATRLDALCQGIAVDIAQVAF